MARAEHLFRAATAALLLTASATAPLVAQQAPAAITLAEALRRTEEVTPGVVSGRGSVRSAELAVRQAKWAFMPQLTLRPQANLQMNSGQSRVDPITGAVVSGNTTNPSYGMNVSASLPLFDGFARNHTLRAARAREDAADANYTTSRFSAALAVTNAFFDALANKELLAISNAAVGRAEEQLKVATAKLRSGSGQRTDSLTALVALSTARQDRLTAQANLANAEATLGRLVGSESRVAAIADSAFYRTPAGLDTTSLRVEAMQQAPALVARMPTCAPPRRSSRSRSPPTGRRSTSRRRTTTTPARPTITRLRPAGSCWSASASRRGPTISARRRSRISRSPSTTPKPPSRTSAGRSRRS
ncbi:MAG: TolC family protein [Gemmatimonadetes bacterium]|nr:TolC family protein [Gemmatimonadota bacterium]